MTRPARKLPKESLKRLPQLKELYEQLRSTSESQLQESEGTKVQTRTLRVLTFDPGETTGYAFFEAPELIEAGQIPTGSLKIGLPLITDLMNDKKPQAIVVEDYRIYRSKAKIHIGSDLHTARLIGTIETLCAQHNIPLYKQSAAIAKKFCTDEKLHIWNLWQTGKRHANDAIRHGVYFMLFNKGITNQLTLNIQA